MIRNSPPSIDALKILIEFWTKSLMRRIRRRSKPLSLPIFGDPIIAPGGDECGHYNGYASSQNNALGLKAEYFYDLKHGGAAFKWYSRAAFESYPSVIHGGVTFALLDEALGHAVYAQCKTFGLTIKTNTRWHRVLKSGVQITGRAKVTKRFWRLLTVEGLIFNEKGKLAADCKAFFYIPSKEQFNRVIDLSSLPKETQSFCGVDNLR